MPQQQELLSLCWGMNVPDSQLLQPGIHENLLHLIAKEK